jgi:hypothetical protein
VHCNEKEAVAPKKVAVALKKEAVTPKREAVSKIEEAVTRREVGAGPSKESEFQGKENAMRKMFWLVLILGFCTSSARARAEESCGPKSGLCWPVVKRGASGPRVTALQYLLRAKGFKLAPDGRFGFSTESAVRRFQAKNKLKVDGKIGWQSWEALTPNLKRGAKGDAVRALQTLLIFQKQKVARDGVFGSSTQNAVGDVYMPIDVIGFGGEVSDNQWCYLSGGYWKGENRAIFAD